ncbi:hypothetical protein [Brevibacillus borstelensis]|uniref:hypothetical protein n=1 Tax=Brevibacillus borstelensis TaxID=45462 RepID=UPI0030F9DA00
MDNASGKQLSSEMEPGDSLSANTGGSPSVGKDQNGMLQSGQEQERAEVPVDRSGHKREQAELPEAWLRFFEEVRKRVAEK